MSGTGRELLQRMLDNMVELLSRRTGPHLHDTLGDLAEEVRGARRSFDDAEHDGREQIEGSERRPDRPMVHADRIGQDLGDIPGIQRVNDGLYRGGGYLLEPRPDGLRLHKDITSDIGIRHDTEELLGVRVEAHDDGFVVSTMTFSIRNGLECVSKDVPRVGGFIGRTLSQEERDMLARNPWEPTAVGLRRQLSESGFEPVGDNVLQLRHGDNVLTAIFGPDDRLIFHKPLEDLSRTQDLIAQSRVLGIDSVKRPYWEGEGTKPALRLSNGWLDYTLADGWVTNPHVVRPVTAADVGITPITPHTEPTGFVRGGDNPTSRIEQLTEINGYRLDDLERWMRPQRPTEPWYPGVPKQIGSTAGFLGPHDSLRQTLARDNDLVRSLGLSHTDLAEAVQVNNRLANRYSVNSYIGEGGHTYTIEGSGGMGVQHSPFRDNTAGSTNHHITNTATGTSVHVSDLGGHMIERYGFYQGPGTTYRSAPEDIISTFGHLLDRAGGPKRLQQALAEVNARHGWGRAPVDHGAEPHPWDP